MPRISDRTLVVLTGVLVAVLLGAIALAVSIGRQPAMEPVPVPSATRA